MEINETPRRTSRNFNINSIELKDFEIPKDIMKFEKLEIINDNSKIKIENWNVSIPSPSAQICFIRIRSFV